MPTSLTFLETTDSGLTFTNLTNHPNLTVLRLPEYCTAGRQKFPPSLIFLSVTYLDIQDLQELPSNLTRLKITYVSIEDSANLARVCFPSVRYVSFKMCAASRYIVQMPTFFPEVTNLTVHCRAQGSKKLLPVFQSVQKLHLKFWRPHELIQTNIAAFDTWKSLVDLTLSMPEWNGQPSKVDIHLPICLTRLSILNGSSGNNVNIYLPGSLTHLCIDSMRAVFTLTMCENAKLHTVRTIGNVFAHRAKFPTSLRSFHVTLRDDDLLDESWEPLPNSVNFQVFCE